MKILNYFKNKLTGLTQHGGKLLFYTGIGIALLTWMVSLLLPVAAVAALLKYTFF